MAGAASGLAKMDAGLVVATVCLPAGCLWGSGGMVGFLCQLPAILLHFDVMRVVGAGHARDWEKQQIHGSESSCPLGIGRE